MCSHFSLLLLLWAFACILCKACLSLLLPRLERNLEVKKKKHKTNLRDGQVRTDERTCDRNLDKHVSACSCPASPKRSCQRRTNQASESLNNKRALNFHFLGHSQPALFPQPVCLPPPAPASIQLWTLKQQQRQQQKTDSMTIPTTTSNGPTLAPLQHIPSHERRHQRLPSITDLHLPRPFLMHPQGQQQQQQLRRGTPEATAAAVALMAASSSASRPQQPQPPNYLQHRPLGPISLPSTLQHSHFTHAPRRPSTLRAASASSFAPNRQGPYPVRHCLGRSASLVPLADATLPGGPLLAVPAPPAHDDNTGRPSSGDSSSSSSITSSITNSPRLVHTSSKGDFYMTDAGEIEILPRAEYTVSGPRHKSTPLVLHLT